MNIKKIIEILESAKPYDKGTAIMWTDEHISKELLKVHLDKNSNLASRTKKNIQKTIEFILREFDKNSGDILDLGCGPGLYTERLAMKGYNVTGLDFSNNSINHAIKSAKEKELDIKYIQEDYLKMDFKEQFDLIIIIFCDFGALSVSDREKLLDNIYKALKPGGILIFDALNEKALTNMELKKNWTVSSGGFWQANPYISLSNTSHFEDVKVLLDEHIVIDEENNYKIYRFWNHYFDEKDIEQMAIKSNFVMDKCFNNIIENDSLSNDETVTFYKLRKL
ncbi:class I SAM-dependent methyltransferase [Clostridiaceae bacterium M8S5]|nr:class I SAM-dependent methyltransferase [Clostridiaceae bacterium M8S5]